MEEVSEENILHPNEKWITGSQKPIIILGLEKMWTQTSCENTGI